MISEIEAPTNMIIKYYFYGCPKLKKSVKMMVNTKIQLIVLPIINKRVSCHQLTSDILFLFHQTVF